MSTEEQMITLCDRIITETRNDMVEAESKPLIGVNVAELCYKQAASISALATIIKLLVLNSKK